MTAQYTLSTFTPGEAERITTITTTMQRDWRRRGFIPVQDGQARFDVWGLAEMWVMKVLADRGIGPQFSKEVAPWCAQGLLWEALRDKGAYEGDHLRTFDWDPEELRPSSKADPEKQAFIEKVIEGGNLTDEQISALRNADHSWRSKAEWLSKQIVKLRGFGRVIPALYFIWWADGSHLFANKLDDAFGGSSGEARYAGAVVVLDLQSMAEVLLRRAGRPLVHVEFETDPETDQLLPPIEYGTPVPFNTGAGK